MFGNAGVQADLRMPVPLVSSSMWLPRDSTVWPAMHSLL